MTVEEKPFLFDILDSTNARILGKKLLESRKVENDVVTYEKIEHCTGDKIYTVYPVEYSIEKVFKYGKSSCKDCYGKGYLIQNIEKAKYPDPAGFLVMDEGKPDSMSGEQEKIWEAMQEKKKFWRVMKACPCAIKEAFNKNKDLLANNLNSIFIKVDYDIREQQPEEVHKTKSDA